MYRTSKFGFLVAPHFNILLSGIQGKVHSLDLFSLACHVICINIDDKNVFSVCAILPSTVCKFSTSVLTVFSQKNNRRYSICESHIDSSFAVSSLRLVLHSRPVNPIGMASIPRTRWTNIKLEVDETKPEKIPLDILRIFNSGILETVRCLGRITILEVTNRPGLGRVRRSESHLNTEETARLENSGELLEITKTN